MYIMIYHVYVLIYVCICCMFISRKQAIMARMSSSESVVRPLEAAMACTTMRWISESVGGNSILPLLP